MSEEQKIVRPAAPEATLERGVVTDVVAAVVGGAASGVAGAVAQQGIAKISGDKGKGGDKT